MVSLSKARVIVRKAFAQGAELGLKPLAVAVLDAGGHVLAFERADGASPGRFEIARAKAYGCLMLGFGGKALHGRAQTGPAFSQAMNGLFEGRYVPVEGGVLIRDGRGRVIGAVGVSGDTSENDALAAVAGVESAGFTAEA